MTRSSSHDEDVDSTPKSSTNSNLRASKSPISNDIPYYSHLKQFRYHELMLATRNLKPELFLGEGGFGKVFKGWICQDERSPSRPGDRMPIAVKTLNREGKQGHKEWVAEINHLGALQHPNLVKLIGYCIEDQHRMLVYEYMPRGSLENHLFKRRATTLTWDVRIKIMLGAAKGLAFLHEKAIKPLIYRDFKTSNILLDSEYNAKLSDFGLAKDAPIGDKTHVTTQVIGTQGYAAPEYIMTGHLNFKSDVYSFGVVLLEMLTGRKAIDKRRSQKEQNLVKWAKPHLKNRGGIYHLIDPNIKGQYSTRCAYKAMKIVAHCIYGDPKLRPLMSDVVKELQIIFDYNNDRSSSPLPTPPSSFKGFHDGSSSSNFSRYGRGDGGSKYGPKVGLSSSTSSTKNTPSQFKNSPLYFTPPFPSPNPKYSGNA
ncbi:unnamed protein product [Lathyrus oleraceus]